MNITKLKEIEEAYRGICTSSKVEAFYQGTDKIRHFIVSVIEPILCGQLELDERETAIVGTYYRIVAWLKALGDLNSSSHYQAVASGARSLFELLLDLRLITSDESGKNINKFHAFPEVEKYRSAKNLVSYCDETNNHTIDCTNQRIYIGDVTKEETIKAIILEYWGKNKKGELKWPFHWSGLSVEQRAKQIGPNYYLLYLEFYPFLSWHIHAGSTGYAGLSPETMETIFGLMHSMIQRVVLESTEICTKEMKIDLIDNLELPIEEIIHELKQTTDNIIVEKYNELNSRK